MARSTRSAKPERPGGRVKEAIAVAADSSKLIEAALASVAVAHDFGEWPISQRGTVSPDLDLEF